MSNDVIEGVIEAVSSGQEALSGLDSMTGSMQRRQAAALYLRLLTDDGDRHTVLLRGTAIRGGIPRSGDRVAVPARWVNGRLEPSYIVNLTTSGERVDVQSGRGAKILFVSFGVIVVLVIFAAFAWVVYGFLTFPR